MWNPELGHEIPSMTMTKKHVRALQEFLIALIPPLIINPYSNHCLIPRQALHAPPAQPNHYPE